MKTTRDNNSGQLPFKAITTPPPVEKTAAFFKAAVSTILFFSISLAVYLAFHPDTRPVFSLRPDFENPARYSIQPQQQLISSFPSSTNISHIAFGIGGSAQTWAERGHYSELWWSPGKTQGFVFLDKKPPYTETSRFKIEYRVTSSSSYSYSYEVRRKGGSDDTGLRLSKMVVELFRMGLPNVRWFVMGDDDTVFFTENLVSVLNKYDHRRMVYIGGNSESVEQNVIHAYDMAYGGGGFAISYGLAAELVKIFDACMKRYYYYGSDQRVWACIGELGVTLTKESGFHQIDIRGDPFGLLAAHPMAPLVSLHHLDYVKPLFPNQTQHQSLKTLINAYNFDPSRTLQQCFCYHHKFKWSVSISWGYVIQLYPFFLTPKDLEKPLLTFQTWRTKNNGPFVFNTRPISPDLCQQPIIFYLTSVEENMGGDTITTYKKFVPIPVNTFCNRNYARAVTIESIIVTAPKMDPREWTKVPRRHCCEINRSLTQGTMRIRIRTCKRSETVTI